MLIRIDQSSAEPLYLQIRTQIIAAIAREEIRPGFSLPSVRSLAGDLGINLHTVNKAYAVLRDEGYIVMRGRSGATIADPATNASASSHAQATQQMEEALYNLALAHKARGGDAQGFATFVEKVLDIAFKEEN
ncbi:MAG: GntR family transcriptional regulator [Eggerthellaceae bacterium]|nr:GntR family transcriptional regulator [Eggerthellaceae bacterium]